MLRTVSILLAIAAASVLVYAVGLDYEFVWDDEALILENRYLADWSELGNNLTGDFFRQTNDPRLIGYWRPVVTLSYMIDRWLFGVDPFGFHVMNLLVHILASWMAWVVARQLPWQEPWPALCGLLFAVHPVHVESVAWVSGRTDVYCGALLFASIWLDFKARGRRWGGTRAASWLCGGLALLSKEAALVLPFWIAARAWIFPDRTDTDGRDRLLGMLRASWPYVAMAAAFMAMRLMILGVALPTDSTARFGRWEHFLTFWNGLLHYLRVLVWPARLSVDGGVGWQDNWFGLPVLAGVALVVGLLWLAWKRYDRDPISSYGILIFLTGVLPLTNFVTRLAGPWYVFPWAERFLYIPSLGFVLVVVWWLSRMIDRLGPRRRVAAIVAVALLSVVSLGIRAHARTRDWESNLTLWRSAHEISDESPFVKINYGKALHDRGDPDRAEVLYREAVEQLPGQSRAAIYNLGNVARERGRLTEAEDFYRQALAIDHKFAHAWLNLGHVLVSQNRLDEAIECFEKADELTDHNAEAKVNLANALRLKGRPGPALPLYREALELEPRLEAARLGFAMTLIELGRADDGLTELKRLVSDEPEFVPARLQLALELSRRGREGEARAEFREILRQRPDDTRIRMRLGLDPLPDRPPAND